MGALTVFLATALLAIVPGIQCQDPDPLPPIEPQNSTYYNPILPGFHPDPSCVFVPEWDDTFFCASSSFNVFPGIPIHATKDLQNWKLIAHVLNRKEQLSRLQETNRSTSGIWAPALRYHDETFYLVTTLVDDDREQEDASRWDNVIFKSQDPYDPAAWSKAVHFEFEGYDTEPFWDVDGKTYITGAHAWRVGPGIWQAEADLDTGELGEWEIIWNGTGGLAPEGPHIFLRDGYYYLLAAEGGTGVDHMVTIARSGNINGPFESNPNNPILSNVNTTNLFQTVGHADIFQDGSDNWWAVALSTRGGAEYIHYPMGRETIMVPMSWEEDEWPVLDQVNGEMTGWPMPEENLDIGGSGPWITEGDAITFEEDSALPPHFTHWRYPIEDTFIISPEDHPNTLKLVPSDLNLTALNGNYAGPTGQTFVGRRQQDTLFTYRVDVSFSPAYAGEEAGVSAFLTQNHHLDMGVVLLPISDTTGAVPGFEDEAVTNVDDTEEGSEEDSEEDSAELVPMVRFRGISYVDVPETVVMPVPEAWMGGEGLTFEIRAGNFSHFSFAVGPVGRRHEMKEIIVASNEPVSWGFTGTLLGIYCTSNGGGGDTPAYFSNWVYTPQGQFRN